MAEITSGSTKGSCKILPCDCNMGEGAIYQDKKYGKGKRVHNPNKTGAKCSVCGKQKVG